jgi:AcrR family transcriptional regulator
VSRRPAADQRERKRLHLLDVAASEFARLGFDQANINTISERAGFGKGTVYLYAASKEQLFLDVLAEIGRETREALDQAIAASSEQPTSARLHAIADAFLALARTHPDFVRLQASALFGVNRRFQDACVEVLRPVTTALTRLFADAEANGAMRAVPVDGLAVLVLGMLQTFALLPDVLGTETALDSSWHDLLADVLWRGLEVKS